MESCSKTSNVYFGSVSGFIDVDSMLVEKQVTFVADVNWGGITTSEMVGSQY